MKTDNSIVGITTGEWKAGHYMHEFSIYANAGCCKIPFDRSRTKGNLTEEQAEANAQAICKAVNNTYGKGINPEYVPDLLEALKNFTEGIDIICEGLEDSERKNTYLSIRNSLTYKTAINAINKATNKQ